MIYGDETDFVTVEFKMRVTVPVGFEAQAKRFLLEDMREAVHAGILDEHYLEAVPEPDATWADVCTWVPDVPGPGDANAYHTDDDYDWEGA